MNSSFSQKLKLFSIIASFLISAFIFFVWLIGPIQSQAYENELFLKKIYASTAFDNCVIVNNTQIDESNHLAQCRVKDTHIVYLNLNDNGKVVDRYNFTIETYLETINVIKNLYKADEVLFSYYKNEFVFDVKTDSHEYLLDIESLKKVLSIRK